MLLEPPVTPDAPTARRWATDELANPAYHQQDSLLVRLLRWIGVAVGDPPSGRVPVELGQPLRVGAVEDDGGGRCLDWHG